MTDLRLTDDLDIADDDALIDGAELIAQRIKIRILTYRGDWILDQEAGLPWLTWLGQRPFPVQQVRARLRREFEAVDGVTGVDEVTVERDADAESVAFTIVGRYGEDEEIVTVRLDSPERNGNTTPGVTVFLDDSKAIV